MGLCFIWDELSSKSISTGIVISDSVQLVTLTSDFFRVFFIWDEFSSKSISTGIVAMVGFWVFFWNNVIFG